MQSHFCKLCFKSFPNGRSLGGHMRSHLLSLPVPVRHVFLTDRNEERRHESDSSDTSEEKTEQGRAGEEEAEGGVGMRFQSYGLRDNPRRSIRLADLEFESEDYEDGSSSFLLQDRESETESSKNFTRRRSKRVRKSFPPREKKLRCLMENEKRSRVQVGDSSEPASSISEETNEEDVALCLMLLSRDRWKNEVGIINNLPDEKDFGEKEDDGTDKDESFDDLSESEVKSESGKKAKKDRGKYQCETCNKVFQSYQAFGGHRASHKKTRLGILTNAQVAQQVESTNNNVGGVCNNKVHECPFCDRVFASGQALGGHKRSHASRSNYYEPTSRMKTITAQSAPIHARGMIDLNMPAPADDESSPVNRVRRMTGIVGQN